MNAHKIIDQVYGSESHWQVNKQMTRKIGLIAAFIFSDLVSKRMYFRAKDQLIDGWFFNTSNNIERDTGLSSHQIRKAISELEKQGFVKVKYEGLPRKKFFSIQDSQLLNFLTTSNEKSKPLDVKKFNTNKNKENNNKTSTKVEGLFPKETIDKVSKKMFRNSDTYLKKDIIKKNHEDLKGILEAGVDIDHYMEKVKRWSDTRTGIKRNLNGWVGTVLNFMESDKVKGKLVTLNNQRLEITDSDLMAYENI